MKQWCPLYVFLYSFEQDSGHKEASLGYDVSMS